MLVAGDVGHYKRVVSLFYEKLRECWRGTVIAVLGNHELWDDNPDEQCCDYNPRPLDIIVNDYRERINYKDWATNILLLQNAVFINYKNIKTCVIEEEQLTAASEKDLKGICAKSTFIVLGGIGFSGCCNQFNADNGLYRSAVTSLQEDRSLSKRFELLYEKMLRCAGDKQVIVLTHTPIENWTDKKPNPKWIYINGHTHKNSLVIKPDGTTVLSDNQIGYHPIRWKLNSFTIAGWYDPFKDWRNGKYKISKDDYIDFNRGRGIMIEGCKYSGDIYVLKKDSLYMFVMQTPTSLCLLKGGALKRLTRNDIHYYYVHMDRYSRKVMEAVAPYQKALQVISDEVCQFGGQGRIHGCIVDIDFCNHIYVNPFDGKITPYFATDTQSRIAYADVQSLLQERIPSRYKDFLAQQSYGRLPLLGKRSGKDISLIISKVPQIVMGDEIYEPSRIMRSFQYILADNVIRYWDDDILTADFGSGQGTLTVENR